MDLVATVSEEEEVDVWRISGQRAFGIKRKGTAEVEGVCWKFNGSLLYSLFLILYPLKFLIAFLLLSLLAASFRFKVTC
jgi:hypothetical protein